MPSSDLKPLKDLCCPKGLEYSAIFPYPPCPFTITIYTFLQNYGSSKCFTSVQREKRGVLGFPQNQPTRGIRFRGRGEIVCAPKESLGANQSIKSEGR